MSQTILPVSRSTVPWPTSDQPDRSPEAATSQHNESAPPEAAVLVMNAGQGVSDTLGQTAERAERHMDDGIAAADEALQAGVHRLRETRADWVSSLRATVRRSPLVSVAAAFALGAAIVRLKR